MPKSKLPWLIACLTILAPNIAWAGGGEGGHAVITNIAMCMVAASAFGFLMKITKQPLLLGYILAGVLIGPIGLQFITDESEILTVAEIGLILLLFMIGLEIDLKKMLSAGRLVIVTGAVQFPICVGLGYLIFNGVSSLGIQVGSGTYGTLYAALAIGISSTMIVVKLLYDKMELDTLPGRITIGILVFQDLWAIIVLAIQPNLSNPEILGILGTFGKGALLVGLALGCTKYVLPRVFRSVAKIPELMLVISLGWCFLVCLVAANPKVGLSMEMGALIAGITMATFPYNVDVIAKVISIRDFFITLFFVALGMQIPVPEASILGIAGIIVVSALAVRTIGVFLVLYVVKAGHRTSLLTTINLCQISEFTLVILSIGVGYGHIEKETMTSVIWAFSGLAVGSTYLVSFSHQLQRGISKILTKVGLKDLADTNEEERKERERPIVLLGFFRVASAFMDEVSRKYPALLEDILVVDFNPEVRAQLQKMGVPCVYGDLGSIDTLHHAEIGHAEVVLCTIPDAMLKGISNEKLVGIVHELCPNAQVITIAESPKKTDALYKSGADFVVQPNLEAGSSLVSAVQAALIGNTQDIRERAQEELEERNEILG
ncbi:MAG: cation:proton antiporter [Myxococcota bacterium]|nr:cation:proton antiporter [Myxococcota bacterium]